MLNLREALAAFPEIPDERWVYRWVEAGELHAVMIGKRWHYPAWELEELRATVKDSFCAPVFTVAA